MKRRCLLDYLLVYIASGRGRFEIGDQEYDVGPNDLFWIPPNTPHDMEGYAPRMVCPYVHFDLVYRPGVSHWDFTIPGGMTDLSELKPLQHPAMSHALLGKLGGRIESHTNRRVGQLIREICVEARRAQPFAFLRTSGLMTIILAEIFRGQAGLGCQYSKHIPQLEKAAGLLQEHYGRVMTAEDASEAAGLSPAHFRKLFGVHYGCSPRAYLRQVRINEAKNLMRMTSLNLTEIARRVGFATVHSFSRAFKEVEGLSPSQYQGYGMILNSIDE